MPIYEYECVDCSKKFEVRRGFHDEEDAFCPHCAGKGRRMFSPVAVIYKGSGFYTTDYGRGNSAPSKRSNGSEDETKPAEAKEVKKEESKKESTDSASKSTADVAGDSK
jgi:putative FmdB family regulatory protein